MNDENLTPPGIYAAKVVDYGIGSTKAGLPQILVVFEFKDEAKKRQQTWTGTLKEGRGKEITMDSLKACGFSGATLSQLAIGKDSNALNMERDVSITITHEIYKDAQTGIDKKAARIAWVNPLGGKLMANRLSQREAAVLLGEASLEFAHEQHSDADVPF